MRISGYPRFSNDATLSALVLTDGDDNTVSLSPTFASTTTTYTASVASTVSRITVNPTPGNSGASVEYLDEDDATLDDADGDSTNGFQVDLSLDVDNVIQVKVTAQDNLTTQTYKVTVSRPGEVCTAPDIGERVEVWSATLMVGHIGMGRTAWDGYREGEGGELSDTSFEFDSETWTIHELFSDFFGAPVFRISGGTDADPFEPLRIHFCDRTLNFEDAIHSEDPFKYSWSTRFDGHVIWTSTSTIEVVLSAPPGSDSGLTGQPTIEGVAAVGKVLKADVGDIRDGFGNRRAASAFSYRWVRVDKSDVETEIGSSSNRYTVSSADVGSEIKVEVSVTDADNNRQTFVSDPAGPVVKRDGQMVGNWGNHGADNPGDVQVGPDRWVAQQFTTGHHGGGYQLTTVRVIGGQNRGGFRGSIWNTGGDGNPDQKLFDLTTTTGSGVAYLTAPPTHRLERWTDYFVVLEPPASGNYEVPSATTNVTVNLPAWDIANHHHTRADEDSPWTVDHSRTLQMTIRATTPFPVASLDELKVLNADGTEAGVEPPLRWSSDSTGTVKRSTAIATIVARPTDGAATVRFRRGDGTLLPDADTNKEHHQVRLWSYANPVEITVTSTDGSRERIYNLMVRRLGSGTQEPATGRLVIREKRDRHNRLRAPQVGDTLELDASDVSDPNGTYFAETGSVLNRFENGFRFLWRVEADDPNTVIGIGGGRSVTLDKNREGRRIYVTMCFRDDLDNLECIESDKTRPVEGEPLVIARTTRVIREASRCDFVYPAGTHCDAETSARNIGAPLKVLTRDGNVNVTSEATFSVVNPSTRTISDEFGNVHEASYWFTIDSNGQLRTVPGETYPFLEAPICTRAKNTHACPAGSISSWAVDPVEVEVRATASNGRYGTVSIPVYVLPHPSAVEVSAPSDTRCNDKRCYGRTLIPGQKLYASNQQQVLEPLTASFKEVPATHDGSTPFNFQVDFSEDIDNTADEVSAAFQVTGGEVTGTDKVDDRSDLWLIEITPGGTENIVIALTMNAECGTDGALCTSDGRTLGTTPLTIVAAAQRGNGRGGRGISNDQALTASFEEVPASHDGETAFTVRLVFNKPVFEGTESVDKNRAVREALDVSGGTVQGSGRVARKEYDKYWISVSPSGLGPVSIALDPPTGECTASTVACTPDGRKLARRVETTIQGPPPGLSVSDATVEEGADAVLAFAVELGRAASGAVSVEYATRDVTATAGEDYAATSGTLTFAAGETTKTIQVPVMTDARDEGDETLTLVLANPSGAYLSDGEATGTIENALPPLTASFENVPAEHDGTSDIVFDLVFSEEVFEGTESLDKNVAVRNALEITGGRARASRRLVKTSFDAYRIWVRPSGPGTVTIALHPPSSCNSSSPTCTPDGRKLSERIEAQVIGPPTLTVADAQADEAPGAVLGFQVGMSRAATGTVTVDYATSDVSATAGADYTETSGTLTFAPGETAKTVNVPVLDDSHDEENETMTLTLSNASGAYITDAEATGTIENSDHMPAAWLSRFGRTVADQMVDAAKSRFSGTPGAGASLTIAGYTLNPSGNLEVLEGQESAFGERDITGRDLMTGSSFSLATGTAEGGTAGVWGRGALSSFSGTEEDLSLDGEVFSTMLGADLRRDTWTAGLLLAHTRATGSYRGADEGRVESELTGLYPYGQHAFTSRLSLWGVAGYGAGTLSLTPEGQPSLETDIDLTMAALGLRSVLVEAPTEGGPELAAVTDVMGVHTNSDAVQDKDAGNLAAAKTEVHRVRLGVEAAWKGLKLGGVDLTPKLELGVRRDGGDAETGTGVDVGGGLTWANAQTGFSASVQARGLLTHESEGLRDHGLAGSIGWDPRPESDRGLSLRLAHSAGAPATGGMDALLGRTTLEGLDLTDRSGNPASLELGLGYGVPAFDGQFTATPELGLSLSDNERRYRVGWTLGRATRDQGSVELKVDLTRTERPGDESTLHGVGFTLTSRW